MRKKYFVLSAALHVLFVHWFTTLKFDHRPVLNEPKAKEIVIVTPVKLYMPMRENGTKKKESFTDQRAPRLIIKKAGEPNENPGAEKAKPPDRESQGRKTSPAGRRIVTVIESKPGGTGLTAGAVGKPGNIAPASAPRFSLNSDTMSRIVGTGGSRRKFFAEYPGLPDVGTGLSSGGSLFRVEGCNILPWARRVLRKVKQSWSIPAAAELGTKGQVGVSITVERDGRVSAVAISQSSHDDSLDEAVLTAFRLSNPLPHLPDDFPYHNLHAYLVFNYNEEEITSPMEKSDTQ